MFKKENKARGPDTNTIVFKQHEPSSKTYFQNPVYLVIKMARPTNQEKRHRTAALAGTKVKKGKSSVTETKLYWQQI